MREFTFSCLLLSSERKIFFTISIQFLLFAMAGTSHIILPEEHGRIRLTARRFDSGDGLTRPLSFSSSIRFLIRRPTETFEEEKRIKPEMLQGISMNQPGNSIIKRKTYKNREEHTDKPHIRPGILENSPVNSLAQPRRQSRELIPLPKSRNRGDPEERGDRRENSSHRGPTCEGRTPMAPTLEPLRTPRIPATG